MRVYGCGLPVEKAAERALGFLNGGRYLIAHDVQYAAHSGIDPSLAAEELSLACIHDIAYGATLIAA